MSPKLKVCGRFFFALILFLISVQIRGSADLQAFEAGYFYQESLPLKPANLPEIFHAAREIHTGGGRCSAVNLSSDGYILTNAHCIKNCLTIRRMSLDNGLWVYKVDPKKAINRQCGNAQIVFVGRGFADFDDREVLNFPSELMDFAIKNREDFAVLKLNQAELKCVPRAVEDPVVGDRVWAIGYPGKNYRRNAPSSDGKSKLVSYGSVAGSIEQNEFFKEKQFSRAQIDALKKFYDPSPHIISDMDTYPGNSGSMTIDANGELVGIVAAIAVPPPLDSFISERFYANAAISVKTSHIAERIREALGEQTEKKIFGCIPTEIIRRKPENGLRLSVSFPNGRPGSGKFVRWDLIFAEESALAPNTEEVFKVSKDGSIEVVNSFYQYEIQKKNNQIYLQRSLHDAGPWFPRKVATLLKLYGNILQ